MQLENVQKPSFLEGCLKLKWNYLIIMTIWGENGNACKPTFTLQDLKLNSNFFCLVIYM